MVFRAGTFVLSSSGSIITDGNGFGAGSGPGAGQSASGTCISCWYPYIVLTLNLLANQPGGGAGHGDVGMNSCGPAAGTVT